MFHLAQDFQQLGWQVEVLAPHAEAGTAAREVIGGVPVERFSYLIPRHAQTVCYHGGALINLRRNRTNLLKLPPLVLAEWVAVARRLASRRYDLLHSHWILPQGFTGALAARPLQIPHVLTVHGGDVFALNSRLLSRFKRFSLYRADAVTVNSSATRAAVEMLAPNLQRLQQIPMGVTIAPVAKDDPRVLAVRQRHRRGHGPLLVFVGRLVAEKGVDDLIAAVQQLQHRHPDVTALIIGDGQYRQHLEALMHSSGLQGRVILTGWVQPEDIPVWLAAGDVFVGPSRRAADGWIEAQGLSFIEAMVARTPVVATRCGGIVDVVIDGQTGLLVPERAPAQIAEAVGRLISDQGLANRLVEAAFTVAVERFSRRTSAAAFSALFSQLLARDPSARV